MPESSDAHLYFKINKRGIECGVVTCDSCKDDGRFADRSCVSRANREVIGCAARHWKLKVCGGNPI